MTDERQQRRKERFAHYQRVATIPLLINGFLFIATFVVQLTDPDPLARILLQVSWLIFLLDYLTMLILTPQQVRFVSSHIPYLVALFVPPLRVFLLLLLAYRATMNEHSPLRDRIGILAIYFTALIIVFGALSVWFFEKGAPRANIETYGDALWWAIVSITTVGYGDFVPVTVGGRFVATLVFIQGIAAIAVLTGVVVSYFSGDRTDPNNAPAPAEPSADVDLTPTDLSALEQRLDRIEQLLLAQHLDTGSAAMSDPGINLQARSQGTEPGIQPPEPQEEQ